MINPKTLMALIEAGPNLRHSHAASESNKATFHLCLNFMRRKMPGRENLVKKMPPEAPFSSRPVRVGSDSNIYDALMQNHVDLVTEPIERLTPKGMRSEDDEEREFHIIAYATGFKANEFLRPMELIERNGPSLAEPSAKDGARTYIGTTIPGFPRVFMVYGPNMNPFFNGLRVVDLEEMVTRLAMKCIGTLIRGNSRAFEVTREDCDKFNAELYSREATKIYADHHVTKSHKNEYGRLAVNCPTDVLHLWNRWRDPADEEGFRPSPGTLIRPYFGQELTVN